MIMMSYWVGCDGWCGLLGGLQKKVKKVFWTDETKMDLYQSDGKKKDLKEILTIQSRAAALLNNGYVLAH